MLVVIQVCHIGAKKSSSPSWRPGAWGPDRAWTSRDGGVGTSIGSVILDFVDTGLGRADLELSRGRGC